MRRVPRYAGLRLSTSVWPGTNSLTVNGPAPGRTVVPSASGGRSAGTAQSAATVVRAPKSGAGCVSRTTRACPRALTPDGDVALPFITASAPTMSWTYWVQGDLATGASTRSIAWAKLLAVTGSPVAKRMPRRIRKVYVRPSRETVGYPAAASGTMRVPSGGARSGYRIRVAHVVERASKASSVIAGSIASGTPATRKTPPEPG